MYHATIIVDNRYARLRNDNKEFSHNLFNGI